jgi:hypothetical protein
MKILSLLMMCLSLTYGSIPCYKVNLLDNLLNASEKTYAAVTFKTLLFYDTKNNRISYFIVRFENGVSRVVRINF